VQKRVFWFTYAFVAGVALSMFAGLGPETVMPLYIAAGVIGVAGWGMAFAHDRGKGRIPEAVVIVCLVIAAIAFGAGRFAQRIYIPPFDAAAPEGSHIRAILDEYPDPDFNSRTRMIGVINSEPEYRPRAGTPGIVALTITPLEVEPEPGSGKIYPVRAGDVVIYLRPSGPFRSFDHDFKAAFEELADQTAYGWVVEVDMPFQTFRSADNPGLFDPELFYQDKDVFASASVSFWNRNAPAIKVIERSEGNFLVEAALNIKKRLLGVIKATVPFPESAFLAGVTLGSRRGLDGVKCKFEPLPGSADQAAEGNEEAGQSGPGGTSAPDDGEPDLRQLILDEFRWSGTSHVLAVSGLHVTIITGALWGLFLLMRIPKKIYAPLVCLGLAIFCLITGAAPSTMRACIMNSLVILTYVYLGTAFRASLLLAIGVAGFAILLNNPKWLIEPAFALSFMAVLSLGTLSTPFDMMMRKFGWYRKMPVWIQQFFSAQLAIQFGMMGPLSAYYFCRMSFAGPIANFFAIPLIGIIVQLGLFACILGLIPVIGLWLATVLNAANYIMIWFFLWVAHISTVLFPFPMVQTMTPKMLGAYYVLMGLVVWWKPLLRNARILYYDMTMGIGGAKRRTQALAAFSLAFLLIGSTAVYGFWPRVPAGALRVNILSVRYGQCIHIETPSGAQIVIDGGPDDYKSGWNTGERTVAQYLLKQRIGSLDAVVMTNSSPEDMGGLSAILRIFPTRRFYSPIPVWQWDPDDPAGFRAAVEKAVNASAAESPRNEDIEASVFILDRIARQLRTSWGVFRFLEVLAVSPISLITSWGPPATFQAEAGMVLWKEEGPGGTFQILALHPNPEYPLSPSNNNSLVLRITYGSKSFLVTSDIAEDGIRELLRVQPELLASDVLVLPAHGSARADVEMLHTMALPEARGDRYAVLSYGWSTALKPPPRSKATYRDSFLSHRQSFSKDIQAGAEATVAHLLAQGVKIARTDLNGAILCTTDGSTLTVETTLGGITEGADVAEEMERHREF
jgi:ComEC/Rec2-related protein